MVDWKPYLESICKDYQKWWEVYTITDVEGKIEHHRYPSMLIDLMVERVKSEREDSREEKRERLDILAGLRKYSLASGDRVLLQGKPGSGKSTALARLLLEEATKAISSLDPRDDNSEAISDSPLSKGGRGGSTIPVLVELRYYQTSILDLVGKFLKEHGLWLETNEIEQLLSKKQFFLLIDGINELPSDKAATDLIQFWQTHKTTPMVFTTRELGLKGDLGIEKKLTMQPLSEPQMKQFVRGYLGNEGENLLKQLKERLKKLGEIPLLLEMLCACYCINQGEIPNNLGETFRVFKNIYDERLKAYGNKQINDRQLCSYSLQYLAFEMTSRKDEPVISQREAEAVIGEFLQKNREDYSLSRKHLWLRDLINHHLLQRQGEEQIEFHHQLIQEYYAAEYLLQQLSQLTDEQLQWQYLNYLKWTEPVALMLGLLKDKAQAIEVVKLALEVDLGLGARLAGEVHPQWQQDTVRLVTALDVPQLYKVWLLGKTGSEVAIPVLIQALQDEKWWVVRDSAAKALGKIGSETAIVPLIQAWQGEVLQVCESAVEALGKIGSETVIAYLIQALQHESKWVRLRAAFTLDKIGSETAIAPLIEALQDEDKWVRYRAAEALGKIGSETAITPLIQALQDEDSQVRYRTAEALGKIGSETAITPLIQALQDEDSQVRSRAAEALGKIGSETAIASLIQALQDEDSQVRSRAAEALGKIGAETAIAPLIQVLQWQGEVLQVCDSAAEALSKIGSETAIAPLIQALQDGDKWVRYRAASALDKIGSETAIASLIQALQDEDSQVRSRAAEALGKIGSETAIAPLIQALQDEDKQVRDSAAEALGKIGSETAIAPLIQALQNEKWWTRISAAEALGNTGSETAIAPLIQALQDEDWRVRSRAAKALGEIGSETAIVPLIEALQDENWSVRDKAASALGEIGSDTAISILISQLKNPDFVKTYFYFYIAIRAIEAIQNKCQHYYPPQPIASPSPSKTSSSSITYDLRGANIANLAHEVRGNQQTSQLPSAPQQEDTP